MSNSERNKLFEIFYSHQKDTYETFQLYEKPSDTSLEKIGWSKVVEMGEAVSRQATIVGMIWTGEPPLYEEIEENMAAYVNTLNGFVLLAYGASVGAGPTLLNSIRTSVKKVLDTSFLIMKESIASHGACTQNDRTIPQLAGQVWEACADLLRTPSTNITAIGRRMTKVAVSVKDVLRELNELKPGPTDSTTGVQGHTSSVEQPGTEPQGDSVSDAADLGNDLTPEEMRVAREAISMVSGILFVIKELLRSITALVKLESRKDTGDFVDSLEKLLKECQVIEPQVDELGACLYPPQEISAIRALLKKILSAIDNIQAELGTIGGATEAFLQVSDGLKGSIARLNAELDRSEALDLNDQMERIDLNN